MGAKFYIMAKKHWLTLSLKYVKSDESPQAAIQAFSLFASVLALDV